MAKTELDELREAVRGFLHDASPSASVRALMDTDRGYDAAVWKTMATELGLHGIAVPEQWGGAGAGLREIVVVFEEMGAALLCAPFFATVALAVNAVLDSGDEGAISEYVPAMVGGEMTGTVILDGSLGLWDPHVSVSLTAVAAGDGFRVSGHAPRVLDGHTADMLFVAATTSFGVALFAVAADAEGLTRTPLATLDRTRKIADVTFSDVPARLIGGREQAADGLRRTGDLALVALAAEQLGAASRCLDMAVDYAKNRIQFGRAIGSFQAVKHRCADMLVLVEGARSAVTHAAGCDDPSELAVAAAVAKLACSEAFLSVAVDTMRVHGGIGFTWEHDAHLYFRRAKSSELMFGDPHQHAERLAELVGS
ncbi:acyl-CoA dehydrogenase family protein [Mycolicibacterium sp. 120266]|uniref:acyl-CoA dehydrogenase family protein n=1 Tax=Mycolicibacterium sp. 120266 TaxID=3090601 RepID=UPI00299DEA57|nr:acyl-CoA dehydrogenase family protein [Mycolicibacterium sp. 120266]MDX1873871.1 acyl-CoA dehydrogenase family protein [Mycolicibacterium sp. 120266]